MKYSPSETTKRELAAALKQLMAAKPLEKITIRELANCCGIRRESFYYHFEDIYDLLKWMLHEEFVDLLHRQDGMLLWQEGLLQLLLYIQENNTMCRFLLDSLGHKHLKRFLYEDIHSIVGQTVTQLAGEGGISDSAIDLDMVVLYNELALVGLLESWALGEIDRTPTEMVAFLDSLFQQHIHRPEMSSSKQKEYTP